MVLPLGVARRRDGCAGWFPRLRAASWDAPATRSRGGV